MFACICCRWILEFIFTTINLFYYTFKICINVTWCFSNEDNVIPLNNTDNFLVEDKIIVVVQTFSLRTSSFSLFRIIVLSYVLKLKQDIFFVFSIQNFKSNCCIIFLDFFKIIFFWWKIYSSPVVFIYKSFNFYYCL